MRPAWSAHPSTAWVVVWPPASCTHCPKKKKGDQRSDGACWRNNCGGAESFDSSVYMYGAIRGIIISLHKEAVWRYTNTVFHLIAFSCLPTPWPEMCQPSANAAVNITLPIALNTRISTACNTQIAQGCCIIWKYELKKLFTISRGDSSCGGSTEGQIKWACSMARLLGSTEIQYKAVWTVQLSRSFQIQTRSVSKGSLWMFPLGVFQELCQRILP